MYLDDAHCLSLIKRLESKVSAEFVDLKNDAAAAIKELEERIEQKKAESKQLQAEAEAWDSQRESMFRAWQG